MDVNQDPNLQNSIQTPTSLSYLTDYFKQFFIRYKKIFENIGYGLGAIISIIFQIYFGAGLGFLGAFCYPPGTCWEISLMYNLTIWGTPFFYAVLVWWLSRSKKKAFIVLGSIVAVEIILYIFIFYFRNK